MDLDQLPSGASHQGLISASDDENMTVFGFRHVRWRQALVVLGAVLSCGFLLLLLYWHPCWRVRLQCVPCSLAEADVLLLRTTDEFQTWSRQKVDWLKLRENSHLGGGGDEALRVDFALVASGKSQIFSSLHQPEMKIRYFNHQKIRYVWNVKMEKFERLGGLENTLTCTEIHDQFGKGLDQSQRDLRKLVYGLNLIDIPVPPMWKLLFKEVLNPFYVFQVFSVCLWFAESYMEYSYAIIAMTLISVGLSIYTVRKQAVALNKMVKEHSNLPVTILGRDGTSRDTTSTEVVPGDTITFPSNGGIMPCDAVLVSGSCVVNESMLTGESVPVTKSTLPRREGDAPWVSAGAEDFRRFVLFCGTRLIQTRPGAADKVLAVAVNTGFSTSKGKLVRSILYPKPTDFKLFRDAFRFLMSLIAVALVGMIYTVVIFSLSGTEAGEVVKKALDIITIAVPPALPAAMTAGIMYAQRRLRRVNIFCISPQRINVCGQINLVGFDKTGTLTEDGLDLWGLLRVSENRFCAVDPYKRGRALPRDALFDAMATCHSLALIDGAIQGDPLDVRMFEATQWVMEETDEEVSVGKLKFRPICVLSPPVVVETPEPATSLAVLKQFTFSSSLQRMSVMARLASGEACAFMKGAPEKVAGLCLPDTVPCDFEKELHKYAAQGYRVIGFASRQLGENELGMERDKVECDLTFLGLMILENKLKPETQAALEELRKARIRTVMITGDNMLTAVTVARTCGMVPPLHDVVSVMDRESPRHRRPDIVYAKMEKVIGHAFDCERVNQAGLHLPLCHDGHHLCRAAAALPRAVAEDSDERDGVCQDVSWPEGEPYRRAPETELLCWHVWRRSKRLWGTEDGPRRHLAVGAGGLGSLPLHVQDPQHRVCAAPHQKLAGFSNYEFLYQDLVITTVIAVTMSLNRAHPSLAAYRPPQQLVSPPFLLSVVLHVALTLACQVLAYLLVQRQPWYSDVAYSYCGVPNSTAPGGPGNTTGAPADDDAPPWSEFASYDNYTVWFLSVFNCITVAFVFSKGRPFRRPIYTNYVFVIVLMLQLGVTFFLLFINVESIYTTMELVCTTLLWRWHIVLITAVHFILSVLVEDVLIENRSMWRSLRRCLRIKSKARYNTLAEQLAQDPSWPPLDLSLSASTPNNGHQPPRPNGAATLGYRQGADVPNSREAGYCTFPSHRHLRISGTGRRNSSRRSSAAERLRAEAEGAPNAHYNKAYTPTLELDAVAFEDEVADDERDMGNHYYDRWGRVAMIWHGHKLRAGE
ncbi:putative cation-transporting ATPase 13A4 isoform X3 [Petromyzon marinus]|uniref:putative cation-transporting ATPase 13A4 isoform X3 n=1 Tax=Petromyzon marinus TaxID=7757 RepID=UPI003F705730